MNDNKRAKDAQKTQQLATQDIKDSQKTTTIVLEQNDGELKTVAMAASVGW